MHVMLVQCLHDDYPVWGSLRLSPITYVVLQDSVFIFSGPYLYYQCTTEKDSLGSPVFKEIDGELKIVALHQGTKVGDPSAHNYGILMQKIHLEEEGQSHNYPPISQCYNYLINKFIYN